MVDAGCDILDWAGEQRLLACKEQPIHDFIKMRNRKQRHGQKIEERS
jgi:hypothetical protein